MDAIGVLNIILSVIVLLTLSLFFYYRFFSHKHESGFKQNEPDLKLVIRPDLLNKLPENEKVIPDRRAQ